MQGGFKGAPEQYEYTPSQELLDSGFTFDSENKGYAEFADWAKETKMSNDTTEPLA